MVRTTFVCLAWLTFLPTIGCDHSAVLENPQARVEGPPGVQSGWSVESYDPGDRDVTATFSTIPESGVYVQSLEPGHLRIHLTVTPQGDEKRTLALLDRQQEIATKTAQGALGSAVIDHINK